MATKWEKVCLGDLLKIVHGWPFKSECFTDERVGRPIIVSIGNFRYSGGFRFESTTIKEYTGDYPKEFELSPLDILLVMTCQTSGGEILGIPGRVPADGNTYLHNQRIGKVVIKDRGRIDACFVYYLALWSDFRRELCISASGTKILHTAPARIEAFEFNCPPLAEQKAIASVLGALDDKIELNRRMNATLEAMARALFQSWFVDFDPVRAKLDGRKPVGLDSATAALFPDSFQDSKVGHIPYGWEVRALSSLAEYLSRGIGPSYIETGGVCVLNQKCIRDHRVDFSRARRHDEDKRPIKDRALLVHDILVNSTGVGTLGRVSQLFQVEETMIVDSHITIVRASAATAPVFLGINLTGREDEIEALGEGSTGQTELSRSRLGALTIITPPPELQRAYEENVNPLLARISENESQSHSLATLRNTLLPMLLSGALQTDSLVSKNINGE
jgi:type I restriction enzyme, S subunit